MTWLVPLLVCLSIAAAFGGLFFQLGRAFEREQSVAPVAHLPRTRQRSHVSVFGSDGAA